MAARIMHGNSFREIVFRQWTLTPLVRISHQGA